MCEGHWGFHHAEDCNVLCSDGSGDVSFARKADRETVQMFERVAADMVVLIHAAFIVFVVAGGMLALRWPRVAWVHLPAALWGAAIEMVGGVCPLTPLENALRRAAGESGYAGGFVEHYLLPLIYPAALTRELQLGLGFGVMLLNVLLYGVVATRRQRRRRENRRGDDGEA